MTTKVAVIQTPPVLLERQETIEGALHCVDDAVAEGALLIVLPGRSVERAKPPNFLA